MKNAIRLKTILHSSFKKFFRLCQCFRFSDIYQVKILCYVSTDACFFAGLKIEVGNGKFPGPMPVHVTEEGRGDNVDAAEGIRFVLFRMIDKTVGLGLQGLFVYPAAKAGIVFIEQQVA